MNATQKSPQSHLFANEPEKLVSRLREIQSIAAPGTQSTPRQALSAAIESLEELIPILRQHLSAQSLLSQDWDSAGRTRMEEQLNQSRSKLRELQVLAESGRRLLSDEEPQEDETSADPVAEALNAYLVPSLDDMTEALEAQEALRPSSTTAQS